MASSAANSADVAPRILTPCSLAILAAAWLSGVFGTSAATGVERGARLRTETGLDATVFSAVFAGFVALGFVGLTTAAARALSFAASRGSSRRTLAGSTSSRETRKDRHSHHAVDGSIRRTSPRRPAQA